jgi:N-acyl-D-aspartate/D-glutamate deacylase
MFDLLFRNAFLLDGTGAEGWPADLAVTGDRIAAIERANGALAVAEAARTIDLDGLALAPGFVDVHTHSDFSLLADPRAESKIRQGVTTEVVGNCGYSPFPVHPDRTEELRASLRDIGSGLVDTTWRDLAGYRAAIESQGIAMNLVLLVGHSALRGATVGFADRPATADELVSMKRLAAEAMEQGAFGLTAGLTLMPSMFGSTDEIVEIAKVVAESGGFYASHMRVWAHNQLNARAEAIEVGRRAGLPVQMSHNTLVGREFWPLMDDVLALIDRERTAGVDVAFDFYPYVAGGTGLYQLLPRWANDGGQIALARRLRDPATRRRIRDDTAKGWFEGIAWDWNAILIAEVGAEELREYQGMMIAEVADRLGQDPLDVALELMARSDHAYLDVVIFNQSEENVSKLMRHPMATIGSDGNAIALDGPTSKGTPHPRFYGTFPRILGRYVREQQIISLPDAIRKMTSLSAARMGITDRGILQAGKVADLVAFDPDRVIDRAEFRDPHRYPIGIDYVVVNGQIVLDDGGRTEARPGRVLGHRA